MSECPSCGFENIPGDDECQGCGQSLSDMHDALPASEVERSLLEEPISSISTKQVLCVSSETSLDEAMAQLIERKIGCLLVVDGDELVGIFSERDLLFKINTDAAELGERPISEFMTPEPQTLESDAKIAFAVQRMDLGGFRHIPIVDDRGHATGILSVRDLLQFITDKLAAEAIG